EYLKTGKGDLKQLSALFGFSNQEQFSEFFKFHFSYFEKKQSSKKVSNSFVNPATQFGLAVLISIVVLFIYRKITQKHNPTGKKLTDHDPDYD
ncbi:MAG: hypothetical protein PHU63_03535, partial [Candidatus ainarchaeum sp.]|nr:hypothetical protein [Candidatus ainarchaeum sp.]